MSVAQEHARLRPVSFRSVRITDEFWAPRIRTARERTLPHCLRQCEQTGRLSNFDKAAGKLPGRFEGYFFNDSDVYKVIEGAAYVLWHGPDPQLEARLDELITRVAAAQQPNGYLNTYFTLTPSEQPWTNTRVRHELYCAGHLLEAGIAYYEVTGKRALLDVALRFVDHIAEVFGPGRSPHVPGHQEIELALVRLYRLTGEERYLRLAEFFVEQRGRAEGRDLYGEYCQDHLPVREQTRMVGHAVRAMYYYSAVTDLAGYNNDPGYLAALERLWHDTVDRKMYITGGIGSTRSNEGFTQPYDLPNEAAYCETCAAVGLCFWSHRLNLLHGQARYADVLERALYNGMLAGVALDGEKFFYVNPLASRGDHHRQPWYRCACCPSNVIRFIPAVGNYIYAQTDTAVYVNLYVGSTVELNLAGRKVALTQETRYPWDGNVRITLNPPESLELDLCLRIPGWCPGARVKVDGESITPLPVADGYVRLARTWRPGAVIEPELPMPIRRMQADPRVEADRGRVALQRGPLVYCLEAVDNGAVRFSSWGFGPDAGVSAGPPGAQAAASAAGSRPATRRTRPTIRRATAGASSGLRRRRVDWQPVEEGVARASCPCFHGLEGRGTPVRCSFSTGASLPGRWRPSSRTDSCRRKVGPRPLPRGGPLSRSARRNRRPSRGAARPAPPAAARGSCCRPSF